MRTTITLDQPVDPTAPHAPPRVRALLRIEGDATAAADRTPLNLALVLDRSGSMAGPKLHAARRAAVMLVQRLRPEDVVAVVAYDDQVITVAEPETGATQGNLTARIGTIRAGGSTNLSGGWLRARELLARRAAPGTLSRILLLTDGLANVGITDPERLTGLCATARSEGIGTTTLGFGTNYDEHLLAAMAEAGGGSTWYIESPDQAPAIFTEEIGGLLSVAAQNLRVTIRPSAHATLAVVHHAWPSAPANAGVRYDIGDLYAREPAALLAEFVLDPLFAAGGESVPVAELVVEADLVEADGRIAHREIRLPVTYSQAEGPHVDPDIRREVLLLDAARARREALERRNRGDATGAREVLMQVDGLIREAAGDDAELLGEATELSEMATLFERNAVTSADVKYMYQRAHDSARARRKKSEVIRRRPDGE